MLSTAACGWSFFIYYASVLGSASSVATATQTAELNEHGHIHYVTPEQSERVALGGILSFVLTVATIGYGFYFLRLVKNCVAAYRKRFQPFAE